MNFTYAINLNRFYSKQITVDELLHRLAEAVPAQAYLTQKGRAAISSWQPAKLIWDDDTHARIVPDDTR